MNYEKFLNTYTHPRKRQLALDLIAGKEGLEKIYTKLRVQEISRELRIYEKDPDNWVKGSCETCGVKI